MSCQFTLKLRPIFLTVFAVAVANAQRNTDSDSLLEIVARNYSQARHYHIEAHLSEDTRSELSGHWSNSFQTAIVAPDGRYRFEARGPRYSWLQVSNGKIEWLYDATSQEYMRREISASKKPTQFGKDQWSYEESQLIDTQDVPGHVVEEIGSVRNPEIIRTEVLPLGDSNIECFVVRGQRKYQSGAGADTKAEFTFWIEKGSNYVRKIEQHWEGALIRGDISHYSRAAVEVYPVVDLADQDLPSTLFEFQPPPGAKRVTNFEQTRSLPKPETSHLIGTMAPELIFHSQGGHLVTLSSMLGKPILIEFWATWCGPCMSAFPRLGKIYSELARDGVVVITVDEDEEPQKAAAFVANQGHSSWFNYHDDGEINRLLPGDGLPQFVLIDGKGRIVYVKSGFDEHQLRGEAMKILPRASHARRDSD